MRQNMHDDNRGVNKLLGQLAGEKKKAGIALCLIAVMAVMWIKVLSKKEPQGAKAAPATQQTDLERRIDEVVNISYVDLPAVPGRNDLISRDFFASAGWQGFKTDEEGNNTGGVEDPNVSLGDGSEQIVLVQRVTALLKLQAIEVSDNRQAYINGKLMSTGEVLVVTDGMEMYECEVVEIRRDSVTVRCREAEIVLKLVQMTEQDG